MLLQNHVHLAVKQSAVHAYAPGWGGRVQKVSEVSLLKGQARVLPQLRHSCHRAPRALLTGDGSD